MTERNFQRISDFQKRSTGVEPLKFERPVPRTLHAQFYVQGRDPAHPGPDTFKTTGPIKHAMDLADPKPWLGNAQIKILDWTVNLDFRLDCIANRADYFDLGPQNTIGITGSATPETRLVSGPQPTSTHFTIGNAIAAENAELIVAVAYWSFNFPGDEIVFVNAFFGYGR